MNLQFSQLSSTRKYTYATIFVLLLTFFLDKFFFSETFEDNHLNSQKPVPITNKVNPQTLASVKQIELLNIELPKPPSMSRALSPSINKLQSLKPFVKNLATEKTKTLQHTKLVSGFNNEGLTQQKLSELSDLSAGKLALYFPNEDASKGAKSMFNNKMTARILQHMHKCIGIDVGAIDTNNNLTLLTNKHDSHSQIMRLASGQLTSNELALLNAYAPKQSLVRLYPQWFDQNLSMKIANAIGNVPLRQLSGQYKLSNNSLWLTKIKVNQLLQAQDWQIGPIC